MLPLSSKLPRHMKTKRYQNNNCILSLAHRALIFTYTNTCYINIKSHLHIFDIAFIRKIEFCKLKIRSVLNLMKKRKTFVKCVYVAIEQKCFCCIFISMLKIKTVVFEWMLTWIHDDSLKKLIVCWLRYLRGPLLLSTHNKHLTLKCANILLLLSINFSFIMFPVSSCRAK